jgi:hypothetical protein
MAGNAVPGNLVKSLSDLQWDVITAFRDTTQHSKVDLISKSHGAQNGVTDVYDGPLGFTSGSFAVMGGSLGVYNNTSAANKRTSSVSNPFRYRPVADDRDIYSQHIINHYIVAFEVTPSGTIPATPDGSTDVNNCNLLVWGEPSTNDRLISYLTTEDGVGSGIVIRFDTRDATVQQNLIQASIPYGYPSRIAFVASPVTPYDNLASHQTNNIQVSIYVDGALVNTVQHQSNTANIWSDASVNSLTIMEWILSIGGRPVHEAQSSHIALDGGLGDIHMRNISIWTGAMSQNDINHIVVSGVRSSPLIEYSDDVNLDPVTTADPNLKGYWRFAGESPQSGVLDLSISANNLENLAQSMQEQIGGSSFSNADNTSDNILFIPGAFVNSAHPLHGSGITYASNPPSLAANSIAPIAVSGTDFNSPNAGFTFGLWVAGREVVAFNATSFITAYGPVPTTALSTSWVDASWGLAIDENEDIQFYLSKDGRMPTDASSSTELVTKCTITRGNFVPSRTFDIHREGSYGFGHLDSIQHLIYSYDASANIIKGYLNGEHVATADVDPSGFHVPLSVDSRIITFLNHQEGAPWTFGVAQDAPDVIIFEPFYFNRPITDSEAKSIALNGISDPVTTDVSGIIGGFLHGSDNITGTIGGYTRGQDTGSGIIGGYLDAVDARDGTIGGYLQSIDNISGIIGGYLTATDFSSGIIGGFIHSSSVVSGVVAGYITAGLIGNVLFDGSFAVKSLASANFDASLQVLASQNASFDASIEVFKSETPPSISIIVPSEDVNDVLAPYSQYFVGQAIPANGKTISRATFYFSDFTGKVVVAESGSNLYALNTDHVFSQSGVYVVRFSAIDSEGIHNSAIRVINLSSGIAPVEITLSGVPEAGNAPLSVQFTQQQESVPDGVGIVANLLDFDDGITTISLNPVHVFTEPGIYRPIYIVRTSQGFIFSDSLNVGVNN